MNRLSISIFALLSVSTTVFAKTIPVSDSLKAQKLFSAMDATGALIDTLDTQNIRMSLKNLSCTKSTEEQISDPGAKPEYLINYECKADALDLSSMSYKDAQNLLRALRGAGVPLKKVSSPGQKVESVSTKLVNCSRASEEQRGDPDAKPETLEIYSCKIAL